MKTLVTGFEAFFGEKINPSALVLEKLQTLHSQEKLICELLPVSYMGAPQKLLGKVKQHQPQALLMLGQAGGRSKVGMEKVALNFAHCERRDEEGQKRVHEELVSKGSPALINPLPLDQWERQANLKNLPIEVSYSAGVFVCNSIYYHSLLQAPQLPQLFLHLPYLPEQTLDKPGLPSLSFEKSLECVEFVLSQLMQS
jgi:pyroglutamyl-peptidase